MRFAAITSVFALAVLSMAAGAAEHVTLSVEPAGSVRAGMKFDLTVRLKIADGYHIQSNQPAPNYIATTLKVTGPEGFQFGEARFPPAQMERAAGETIPVFSGTVEAIVPVTAPKALPNAARLQVTCGYQACDEGSCFPPTEIQAEVALSLAGSGASTAPGVGSSQTENNTGAGQATNGETARSEGAEAGTGPDAEPAKPTRPEDGGAAESGAPPDGAPEAPETGASPIPGYAMSKITQFVGPDEFVRFLAEGSDDGTGQSGAVTRLLNSGNLLLALPLIFLLGLALNLTPCVYPIIPITISYFGAQAGKGGKPLTLAVFYVLGMALMYSILGVAAGLTGGLFGAQLQNPWVLLAFALVMFALALSQFDRRDGRPIWEFQLPSFLRNRTQARSGILGAVAMGLMVGVVAAPCIGPAVIALLQWVGAQQSPALGFGVFFSLALGLGVPYLFLATASGSMKALPRAGEWMLGVKRIFGAVLIWMGFYYLQTPLQIAHPVAPKAAMVGVSALIGLYLLVLDRSGTDARVFAAFRRLVGLAAIAVAVWMALPAPAERIAWRPYNEAEFSEAIRSGKPVLLDFSASWCAACKELEHKTFSDAAVGAASRRFAAFRGDMTNFGGTQAKEWQKTYGISGLPTVVRLEPLKRPTGGG